jgi:hypothetical protein
MKTIITVQYTNYTENIIVNNSNSEEVLNLLMTDKSVVDYSTFVEGEFAFEEEVYESAISNYKPTSKVNTVVNMKSTCFELERINYFESNKEAFRIQEKIQKLNKRITEKQERLTNIERLFV